MRILVTGSDGLVATNIIPFLKEHFEIIPALEKEWDITDRDKGRAVLKSTQPHVLLNLAAMTNVDGCEDILDRAHKVNAEGPGVLADLCREEGVKIAHFSTDYVFDGAGQRPYREDDRTNPLSVYGRTKLLGEKEVMKRTDNFLVIRTQWIYGEGGENFITKVTRLGKEKGAVSVVNDQTGSPTYAKDLAQPVAALIQGNCSGIYHVTNDGSCTWFDLAREIFSILSLPVTCLPISSDQLRRKATRPTYSVFDCSKVQAHTGHHMRHWREALQEYLTRQ